MVQGARNQGTHRENKTVDASFPAAQGARKTKQPAYLILALVIAVFLVIIGVFYYQAYIAPFRRTIITVDDTKVRVGYFLERARMAGADPFGMVHALTNEILVQHGARQYGITVTPQEIDLELRRMAGGGDPISESAFKEWYRQQLNQAKVSDSQYREVVENDILTTRLRAYLADRVPTVVPQVHLSAIFVNTEDEARKAVQRWEAGEDFASLARELSADSESSGKGGDLGWIPRGATTFDAVAFDLGVGKISQPLAYTTDPNSAPTFYYVLLVTDTAEAREADEAYLPALRARALDDWLARETPQHNIKWNFDSEMNAWLSYQLAKGRS